MATLKTVNKDNNVCNGRSLEFHGKLVRQIIGTPD